ncbi:Methylthioribose-1-phosphate isomerase [Sphaceloma murrayae]|uniref:Methylthioribose-1-phosphate isomerase n=1 Tax=Sphaceloma murrayae TaxID=2082308 RepID=A0A2K1QG16_9PEZI|nr:Methylthioribose-1-phosphate isomerase [Sphaceloma murrayae]
MVLQAIKYQPGRLEILDQLQLPHAEHFDTINDSQDAWAAIKEMRTRGAPAIAIVAALGLAVEMSALDTKTQSAQDIQAFIVKQLDYLVTSRPTAVNLADAAGKLERIIINAAKADGATGDSVKAAYIKSAEQMLVDDVADNEAIGRHGAKWILDHAQSKDQGVSVVTHCNTGSLATAGYGTALGVIRSLHAESKLKHAYCTETRPYNQGSRLTAFELVHDQIPATLITDSMAAALLRLQGPSQNISAIVVGADRVAANGDTANKIGTYSLAILAKHHNVRFLVAAPRTTIDRSTKSGADIIVEMRPGHEMTYIKGPKVNGLEVVPGTAETVKIAATGIDVWNPAFDVTPAELIDGIITEKGVVEKGPDGTFNFESIFAA